MGEESELQPPERLQQEQHLPAQPSQTPQPSPRMAEHGYWSLPPDAGAEELQAADQAVTAAATGPSDVDDPQTQTPATPMPRSPRAPTAALGWVALSLAAACVIADVVAVVLATQRYWVSATLIAEGADVATVIVFVVGLFAAWRKPARWLGIIAMVVAIFANPFILSHLLALFGG